MTDKVKAQVGDTIRVLRDAANGADVKSGDLLVVRDVGTTYVVTAGSPVWIIRHENYEVVQTPAAVVKDLDGHTVTGPVPPTHDNVFRPAHYARFPIEPITFITANKLGFLVGNVIKYVLRHDAKNGLEDLKKARRYLDIMIEDAERTARGESLKVETV